MLLPDATRLRELRPEGWGALGARLKEIGYAGAPSLAVRKLLPVGTNAMRAPMAKWHARRTPEPWGTALRMFLLGDPVTVAEATAALGEQLALESLVTTGLLERNPQGTVTSRYAIIPADDALFLSDHLSAGGEAVMGPGGTTLHLLRAAYPLERVGSALDLGCGAGTAAILLASRADRVVATDISERAIALARVNGWMNAVRNVDFRVGDLFAPVASETFDLVVSQPPFIARPHDAPETTFLFGGARGDELPLRVLRGLSPHLSPGAIAIVLVEWPVIDGDPALELRLREALPASDVSLLLLQGKESIDDHCALYASLTHPERDEAWERAAIERRDHFEALKVRELRPSFTVARRSSNAPGAQPGWTHVAEPRRFANGRVMRSTVDGLIAVVDLLHRGVGALPAACLRVPRNVSFLEKGDTFEATFGDRALHEAMPVDGATIRLMDEVNKAESVGEAVAAFALAMGEQEDVTEPALERIAEALHCGLLELA